MSKIDNYLKIEKIFEEIDSFKGAKSILYWDMVTNMPKNSAKARTGQLSALNAHMHDLITSEKLGELIKGSEQEQAAMDDWQKANLREIKRLYAHETCLDREFATEFSTICSETELVWQELKPLDDYQSFKPHLRKMFEMIKKMAVIKSQKLGLSEYDALLDQYDPGRKSADIDVVFADLKTYLPGLIEKVISHQNTKFVNVKPLVGSFPINDQKDLGMLCMRKLGFDFERGRLDVSVHPFCGGLPDDVRITTRYDENEFISSLNGILHETGHALYEQHLPQKYGSQPVGDARGMSIHESQSLFIEMQIARSKEFISFIIPEIEKHFNMAKNCYSKDDYWYMQNKVERSLIRVDADEVTYPCHVIMRYEIEKMILAGDITVDELPDTWNQLMEKYVGIKPHNFKEGCMQDVHWAGGSFGYFPTYSLGAIFAAQIAAKMRQDMDFSKNIANGEFSSIICWLDVNLHKHGSFFEISELPIKVTGEKLTSKYFKEYLEAKYLS